MQHHSPSSFNRVGKEKKAMWWAKAKLTGRRPLICSSKTHGSTLEKHQDKLALLYLRPRRSRCIACAAGAILKLLRSLAPRPLGDSLFAGLGTSKSPPGHSVSGMRAENATRLFSGSWLLGVIPLLGGRVAHKVLCRAVAAAFQNELRSLRHQALRVIRVFATGSSRILAIMGLDDRQK